MRWPAAPLRRGKSSPHDGCASQRPISQLTLGNNLVEVRTYDTYRQQPIGVTLGTSQTDSSSLNLGFNYCPSGAYSCVNNNGNLQSQTIAPLGVTQAYTYDNYNRLTKGTETAGATTTWSEAFSYDSYGKPRIPSGFRYPRGPSPPTPTTTSPTG